MKQLIQDMKEGHVREGLGGFFHRKHLPVLGYILLALFVGLAFYLQGQDRAQRRQELASAFKLQCERTNELSNNQAADIYQNWVDLEKNAKLLKIEVTPELRQEVLVTSNRDLKQLKYYDCTISPYKDQVFRSYQPILADKPLPKIPPRLPSQST